MDCPQLMITSGWQLLVFVVSQLQGSMNGLVLRAVLGVS